MVILGPANNESPDERRLLEKAMGAPRPEQVLDVELKMTFPMRQWSWGQRRRYTEGLDAVLYQHIMGKSRDD
jgi:hypothetical protein